MTNGQARVLVLLAVLLVLESVVSKPVHDIGAAALKGKLDLSPLVQSSNGKLPAPAASLLAWSIGGLALFALAGMAPNVATTFTLVLIVLVLVSHGTAYAQAGQSMLDALTSLGAIARTPLEEKAAPVKK